MSIGITQKRKLNICFVLRIVVVVIY